MAKKILGFQSIGKNKNPYLGFFSQNKNAIIRSASYGIHHPVGNLKITNRLKDFNRNQLKDVRLAQTGPFKGLTEIQGNAFAQHLDELSRQIDVSTWMFVQAWGSHVHKWFQESFDNKRLGTRSWKALTETTKNQRSRLGFSRTQTLTRTGRLKDSLSIYPSPTGKGVTILTKPNGFQRAYPEFIGTHRRKKGAYNSGVGDSGFSVNGKKLYGRMGRIYAGWHLEKNSRIYRPYMTEDIRGAARRDMTMLMDDILFYGVFNRVMGFSTHR